MKGTSFRCGLPGLLSFLAGSLSWSAALTDGGAPDAAEELLFSVREFCEAWPSESQSYRGPYGAFR